MCVWICLADETLSGVVLKESPKGNNLSCEVRYLFWSSRKSGPHEGNRVLGAAFWIGLPLFGQGNAWESDRAATEVEFAILTSHKGGRLHTRWASRATKTDLGVQLPWLPRPPLKRKTRRVNWSKYAELSLLRFMVDLLEGMQPAA